MIWFTSDTHYNHINIIKGTSNWDDKSSCRNFPDLETHNKALINNINKVVKWDDELYLLGDVAFGRKQKIYEFITALNCKNIHLILGNHDKTIWKDKELQKQLFLDVQGKKEININGQKITLNHFAQRTWNKAHHGAWMLFGHSHGSMPDYKDKNGNLFKTMDVGIDTHPEFRPYSYTEIFDIMEKRIPLKNVDHH